MEERTAFLPSRDGLRFSNAWPPGPAVSVRTPLGRVGIGNAARGLCGGMVFAALDYWRAGRTHPPARPGPDDRLFRFIVRRLIDSWHVPWGVLRYYRWMRTPDQDLLRQRTVAAMWPQVKHSIDTGRPAPLGVVTVASANPLLIGHNHQVLCYGYQTEGSRQGAASRLRPEFRAQTTPSSSASTPSGRVTRSSPTISTSAGRFAASS